MLIFYRTTILCYIQLIFIWFIAVSILITILLVFLVFFEKLIKNKIIRQKPKKSDKKVFEHNEELINKQFSLKMVSVGTTAEQGAKMSGYGVS